MSRTLNLKDAINRSREVHPVISAAIVAAHTDNPNNGGATAFNDRRIMAVGEGAPKGWAIAGEPDTEGKQIPTDPVEGPVTRLDTVLAAQSRIYRQTGNRPRTGLGTWRKGNNVDYDASGIHDVSKTEALRLANTRGEKSIFRPETFAEPWAQYGNGDKTRAAMRRKALGESG